MDSWKFSEQIRVDFDTEENAVIAARCLSTDSDLKPEESSSTFTAEGKFLVFSICAKTQKALDKAKSTTMPSIDLIQRTIAEFKLQ